jgi:UDP-N-acetylglucosamine 2-epimerase
MLPLAHRTSLRRNLKLNAAGVKRGRIFFVGYTMIDTLLTLCDRLNPPPCWAGCGPLRGAARSDTARAA